MRASFRSLKWTLALASLATPAVCHAQTIPSSYEYLEQKQEIGPFVGHISTNAGRFGFGPKGGTVLGVRWGIEMSGPLSFEGVVGLLDSERDIVHPGREVGDQVVGVADALMTTIDLRLKFSLMGARAWKGISPFIVFGGGMAFDAAATDTLESDLLAADRFDFGSSFYGTMGGGSRWFISDHFGLRADGVFSFWKLDTPPGFSDPDRSFEAVEESEWSRGLSFTISALYRW